MGTWNWDPEPLASLFWMPERRNAQSGLYSKTK